MIFFFFGFFFLFQGCHYKYLKSIRLERCQSIKRLPDLCAPNLETLDISYCENLVEIHDSIGLLDKLECLVLSGCMNLQILPSTLKLNKRFVLSKCPRVEKFPNVHPEMKCLEGFSVTYGNIREWPLSLRYLTEGIIDLFILECENLGKFLDSTNKLQLLEEIDTPVCNHFNIIPTITLFVRYREILNLDFCMKNDFFPALRDVTIQDCNIVSIPECIFRLPRLKGISIRNCKELREIQSIFRLPRLKGIYIVNCKEFREFQNPTLPQSIRCVIIEDCPSLLPQSTSRLLNQVRSLSLIIKQ